MLGTVGYEPEVAARYDGMPLSAESPLTEVSRSGVLRLDSRAELDERYPHLPHSSLSESFAGVPLEVDGRVLGVMALSAARPGAFPDEDLDYLLALARHCAQALERGRLFEAEQVNGRRLAFLAMASERLSRSLDYHETLDVVAALAVPALGDWCSVHLLDAAGAPALVGVHHRDEELRDLLEQLFVRYPPDPGRGSGVGQALGEQRTVHHRRLTEDVLRAIARDDWHLQALHRLVLGSALVVPLLVSGRLLGVLTVSRQQVDAYSDDDVRLVDDLATRSARRR